MTSPIQRFKEKVSAGLLDADGRQEQAAQALDRLYQAVVIHHGQKTGWVKRMAIFKGKEAVPRGVYMYGPVGRGKSMLMDMFYDAVPFGIKKRRVHFHQFMIEVHDYIHSRRSGGVIEDMEAALPSLASIISNRSKILCFDEFHVTDVADAMLLGRLFTAIFDHGVSVVITSNWQPDDLYKGGLQRERFLPFIELIKKRMDVICLDGEIDYRARKLKELSVYFTPLGTASAARADNLFVSLTDEEDPHPDLISVKGRTIQVPLATKGVARFGFAHLCERPLGAEDYIAIAKRYHTVFLENVPRLGYDRRNEAKRLMTLVDILYDHHRNLVITAEEQPDRLYSGTDHAFEFQRTVSRLQEMQTPEYFNRKT